MIRNAIQEVVEGRDLTEGQAVAAFTEIMDGTATPAQISALLLALRMKGETPDEIFAVASVMREKCIRVRSHRINDHPVDLCGTGGAPVKTFNVSTISAFVVAGCGVTVAKHGNRSFTSKCGSADLMEALGVNLNLEPSVVEEIMNSQGLCFMFAPKFHPAMKYAAIPRKEIGLRTIFNIVGPLANPAWVKHQLLGVYSPHLVDVLPGVLKRLDVERALVVYGEPGIDEISTLGPSIIGELKYGSISRYTFDSKELGIPRAKPEEIADHDADGAVRDALSILRGEAGAKANMVFLNAAAGLWVAGEVDDLSEGMALAQESVDSGKAYQKLVGLVKATGGDASRLEALQ